MTDEQDIVERLRAGSYTLVWTGGSAPEPSHDEFVLNNPDGPEAASLIERLRREVEELKAGNAALEGEVDFRGDALVKASVAVNASYAQAHAEWHGHDKVASRHDATVREGREAIREALDLEKMQARQSLAKEARHD